MTTWYFASKIFSQNRVIFFKITPYTMQLGYLFASKPHTSNKVRSDDIKNSLLEELFSLWCSLTTPICTKMWNVYLWNKIFSHISVQECDVIFPSIIIISCAWRMHKVDILSINPRVDFLCTDKIVIDTSFDKTL